jgi:hypothetical protein
MMGGWGESKGPPPREVLLKDMTKAINTYILNPTTGHFEAMKIAYEVFERHEETK